MDRGGATVGEEGDLLKCRKKLLEGVERSGITADEASEVLSTSESRLEGTDVAACRTKRQAICTWRVKRGVWGRFLPRDA